MYEKINRSVPSNRRLIDKLKKEGKPYITELEDALIFKNSLQNTFSQKNINKSQNNSIEGPKRINYSEAMKFIHNFNKKMTKSINSYNQRKRENNYFKNSFGKVKKLNKKIPSLENEKINFIYGGLIKKYEQKGIKITKEFFDKDIYKECGLLMLNNDINKFYKYDFTSNDEVKEKRAAKNLNFLIKIKRQAQRLYNKKLIESKKLQEDEKIIYFNSANKMQNNEQKNNQEKKQENKDKRQNLNIFINKVNIIIKEIKEEKDEIKKLKKLILAEEKAIKIQKKKYQEENFGKILNEEENDISNKRREKKTKTINPIMSFQFGKKNKNENNKLNSEESNHFNSKDNIIKENIHNTSQINNLNNQNINQSESTNITHNNIEENRKSKNILSNIYSHFSLSNLMRKRLSSISHLNRSNNSNNSSSLKSIFINLKKKRRASLKVHNIKKSLTVSDTYEKISNLDFISYKKNTNKRREKVKELLKKYYGKKYQEFNKKNNHIKILNNYIRLREEILNSEKKLTFVKYKNDLPLLMKNRIETNLQQNEKLKNYGNIFIQSFYDKKLKD